MSTTAVSITPLLRQIGRGRDGSRPLTRTQARDMMSAVLDGGVSDLELGAALMALRMKGETADEIAGFVDAMAAHVMRVPTARACVVIPTYNGARLLPNLVPLLALLLARDGVPVLLHGQASEPGGVRSAKTRLSARVTTLDVLVALGIAPCASIEDVLACWGAQQPAYLPLDRIAPPLARLVGLRHTLGVRNVAHTMVKLLMPVTGPAVLFSSHTHAEFGSALATWFATERVAALSMRGTEGEAVAHSQRPQPIELWFDGRRIDTIEPAKEGAAASITVDAASTAAWTNEVLSGGASPQALMDQVGAAHRLIDAIDANDANDVSPASTTKEAA